MRTLLAVVALLAGCRASPPAAGPDGEPIPVEVALAAAQIDEDLLRDFVADIASDAMQGRGPGTAGDRAARGYLAEAMAWLGLEPGFGDSWEQPFAIVGVTAAPPPAWTFRGGDAEVTLSVRDQYMAAAGVQQSRVEVTDAELVFVGYGIQAPEESWDDFGGQDVRGKILLMLNDDPDWDADLFAGARKLYYGRWTYKYESAARQGAAGAIIIHTTESAGYPWAVVQSSWSGTQFEVPAGDEPRVPVQAWVTRASAEALVALGGRKLEDLIALARSGEFVPVPLGVTTSIAFDVSLTEAETANVAGLLRGETDEVVVVSAHHDHLGVGNPDESGDTIYNGALDNGAAMAQVYGIARALVSLEPARRSVLFFFPAAEEQGLLGSRYFAEHPSVPAERLVADVNFELGNIWGATRDVTIYGKGKSTLDDVLEGLAAVTGRRVHAEEDVRAGWFYRSDQVSFARVGVPAIWFRAGTGYVGRPGGWGAERFQGWIANHYHRPSDELTDEWDLAGLVQDGRLGFLLVHHVANAAARPRWYPGDEFAARGTDSHTPARAIR